MVPPALNSAINLYRTCLEYADSGTITRQPLNQAMVAEQYTFHTEFERDHRLAFAGRASHNLDYLPVDKDFAFAFVRRWHFSMLTGEASFSATMADGTSMETDSLAEAVEFCNSSSREAFSFVPAMLLSSGSDYFKFNNYLFEAPQNEAESTVYRCKSADGTIEACLYVDGRTGMFREIEVVRYLPAPMDTIEKLDAARDFFLTTQDASSADKVRQIMKQLVEGKGPGMRTVYTYELVKLSPREE